MLPRYNLLWGPTTLVGGQRSATPIVGPPMPPEDSQASNTSWLAFTLGKLRPMYPMPYKYWLIWVAS